MLRQAFRKMRRESGQAVVELAITLPILIILLCGIIDYGWIITNQNAIDHSAREGARYAIVHATDVNAAAAIQAYAIAAAPANIRNSLSVNVTFTNSANRRNGDVIVEVMGEVRVLTPLAGIFVEGQILTLSSSCRMKVE